jgi:predicted nucleotidyltransferase
MGNDNIIKKIRTEILKLEPDAEIYLFGSRARGDFREDSDWDVLIISPLDKITFDYEMKLREPIFNLEIMTGEVISVIIYPRKDWQTKKSISPLFYHVSKEGIKI